MSFFCLGCLLLLNFAECRAELSSENTPFTLVVQAEDRAERPDNFRTFEAEYKTAQGVSKRITIAVSRQFSEKALHEVVRSFPSKKIEVINMREEPYVFIDGTACGIEGIEQEREQDVSSDELASFIPLRKTIEIRSETIKTVVERDGRKVKIEELGALRSHTANKVCTEEELLRSLGLKYTHIPIVDNEEDFSRLEIAPRDTIDKVVETLRKSFEESDLIYIHCKGGKSRSPSIVVLALIMLEAQHKGMEAIEASFEKGTPEARKFKQYKENFYTPFFDYLSSPDSATKRWSDFAIDARH